MTLTLSDTLTIVGIVASSLLAVTAIVVAIHISKQSIVVNGFNDLLTRSNAQLDSLIAVNSSLNQQVDILNKQFKFNLNVQEKEQNNKRIEKIDQYNRLIALLNRTIEYTYKHDLDRTQVKKGEQLKLMELNTIPDMQYILTNIYSIMSEFHNAYELLLDEVIRRKWFDCYNEVLRIKTFYDFVGSPKFAFKDRDRIPEGMDDDFVNVIHRCLDEFPLICEYSKQQGELLKSQLPTA